MWAHATIVRFTIWDICTGLARCVCVTGVLLASLLFSTGSAQGAGEADKLRQRAIQLQAEGQADAAISEAQRELQIREQARDQPVEIAITLLNLATLHLTKLQFDSAEPYLERALPLFRQHRGSGSREVASTLGWLGTTYQMHRRQVEAEDAYKESLKIWDALDDTTPLELLPVLGGLATFYDNSGRYADALPLHKRHVEYWKKAAKGDDENVAGAIDSLALAYANLQRDAEAKTHMLLALRMRERLHGRKAIELVSSLDMLTTEAARLLQFKDAEAYARRSLKIREDALGKDHVDVATSLDKLSDALNYQQLYTEAEPLRARALKLREAAFPPGHQEICKSLNNSASQTVYAGRSTDGLTQLLQAVKLCEASLGADDIVVITLKSNLIQPYAYQARYREAETVAKEVVAAQSKVFGAESEQVAAGLQAFAGVYALQNRYDLAEGLMRRSLDILIKSQGEHAVAVGVALGQMAAAMDNLKKPAEAEQMRLRALRILEKAYGQDYPHVRTMKNDLAVSYAFTPSRYGDAERLFKSVLRSARAAKPTDPVGIAIIMNNLAVLYGKQKRWKEATDLDKQALRLRETALGPEHPQVEMSLDNLGMTSFAQSQWRTALDYWRRSKAIAVARAVRGASTAAEGGSAKSPELGKQDFRGLVKVLFELQKGAADQAPAMLEEAFEAAQQTMNSAAAASMAQMSARLGAKDAALSSYVRERQDLAGEWSKRDQTLVATLALPTTERETAALDSIRKRLKAIDDRIDEIDQMLSKSYPDYASIANPKPLTIAQVQARLGDTDALLLFLDSTADWPPSRAETFIWLVTKTKVRWVRSNLGTEALNREVAALRCGLDASAWDKTGGDRCADLSGVDGRINRQQLPFDGVRANRLYEALLGDVEDLLTAADGEPMSLIIVPSGPLQQLPFHVLVAKPPAEGQRLAWLMREHSIRVLPSVASLGPLQDEASREPLAARRPLLALANPLLSGSASNEADASRAALAREKTTCAKVAELHELMDLQRSFAAQDVPMLGGIADAEKLRQLTPIPQTADLVCEVAKTFGATEDDVYLGGRATEAELKQLSKTGRLAEYAVLALATHGLISGSSSISTEPGLVLTPPQESSEDDDGYLSASDVAGLKLNADWVILSACNSAAGDRRDADALSGLARAFFYAGARALLVSHWSIREDAAVDLVTRSLKFRSQSPSASKADALRQAMIELADSADPTISQPSYWAPFVIVGN